eukprot:6210742-Amphidinium_carterae.1
MNEEQYSTIDVQRSDFRDSLCSNCVCSDSLLGCWVHGFLQLLRLRQNAPWLPCQRRCERRPWGAQASTLPPTAKRFRFTERAARNHIAQDKESVIRCVMMEKGLRPHINCCCVGCTVSAVSHQKADLLQTNCEKMRRRPYPHMGDYLTELRQARRHLEEGSQDDAALFWA